MATTVLTVPAGRVGVVQTPYGTYAISNGTVTVDSRAVVQLLIAGFTSSSLPTCGTGDVTLQVPSGIVGQLETEWGNFPIVNGMVTVPRTRNILHALIGAGFTVYNSGLTALVISDFKNGEYSIGGVSKAITDLWLQNEDWSNWDAVADLIPDVGLGGEEPSGPVASMAVLEALGGADSGATLVIDYTINEIGDSVGIELVDLPDYNFEWDVVDNNSYGTPSFAAIGSGDDRVAVAPHTVGQHRLAFTATAGALEASMDGRPAVTGVSPGGITNALGLYHQGSSTIQGVTIYPPQLASALPALSRPDWIPEGSLAYAGFNNGQYSLGEVGVSVSDAWVADPTNWNDFDPATDLLLGTGLVGPGTPVASATLLDALNLVDGVTVVCDYTVADYDGTGGVADVIEFGYTDLAFGEGYFDYGELTTVPNGGVLSTSASESHQVVAAGTGVRRVAATFTPSGAAASVNGSDVVTSPAPTAFTPGVFYTWVYNATGGHGNSMQSIIFYPPQPSSDLPVLSTLS